MSEFAVTGIGNAIVDVLSRAEDSFLEAQGMTKNAMVLIDAAGADRIYAAMGPGIEASGGSAANTIAGLAGLGARVGYIGRVADDQLGAVFAHDVQSLGVHFKTARGAAGGSPTARCLILVTPDGHRTMNTYLGACTELGPDDIDGDLIRASAVTYMEGYLWDPPLAKRAFLKAMDIARGAGRQTSISLSDSFCVDRHKAEFLDLVRNRIDLLFANEDEIKALFDVDDFDEAVRTLQTLGITAALTRSEKGSVVVTADRVVPVAAEPVRQVVDTTGAGDLYAAGFLYGFTRDLDLGLCGRLGGAMAAAVIQHMGPRPAGDLKAIVRDILAD